MMMMMISAGRRLRYGLDYRGIKVRFPARYFSPIITLHDKIIAREYVEKLGNQVHPMIQTLFLNNDAPIHRAGNVRSWSEEHEGELNTFSGQHNHQI
jgi:hypothetical protein